MFNIPAPRSYSLLKGQKVHMRAHLFDLRILARDLIFVTQDQKSSATWRATEILYSMLQQTSAQKLALM